MNNGGWDDCNYPLKEKECNGLEAVGVIIGTRISVAAHKKSIKTI